jgi:hypothetical protein
MANSGKYDGWKEIQKALAKEGFERTFGLLASDRIRLALDVQCSKSRQTMAREFAAISAGIESNEMGVTSPHPS